MLFLLFFMRWYCCREAPALSKRFTTTVVESPSSACVSTITRCHAPKTVNPTTKRMLQWLFAGAFRKTTGSTQVGSISMNSTSNPSRHLTLCHDSVTAGVWGGRAIGPLPLFFYRTFIDNL